MNAYVLLVVISQMLGNAGSATSTQYKVGEYPSMDQCRKAARSSEVVNTINGNAGPKPRIDFICVERSKLG